MSRFISVPKVLIGCLMLLNAPKVLAKERGALRFGIIPWEEPKKLEMMYEPLMNYLSEVLNQPCKLEVMGSYNDLVKRMSSGNVHIGFFTPKTYVTAKNQLKNLKYIATHLTLSESGKLTDFYEGVIISRKGSDIESIADAKNKTIAFTHQESSSGYVYPSSLLRKMGVKYKEYFSQVFFLKKHHRITGAIYRGTVDIGVTWDGELENAVKKYGDAFTIVAKTRPIPNDPVAAAGSVSEEVVQAIAKALSLLNSEHLVVKEMKSRAFPDEGFFIRDDGFYDVVRDIVNE